MPDPGVSLIPRGSKSTKKRRTSFRPASKKSNQNKSKAATSSSTKTSKASISKNDEEPSTSIADVAASKIPAQANAAEATTNKDDDGASQPLSPKTKSSASKAISKAGGDETISESEAPTSKAKRGSKESTSSRTTRASAAAASAATKTTTRKRKSITLNKRISIGSSLRRKTDISNDTSASPTGKDRQNDANSSENIESTAIVPASKSKDGEGKENVPKASDIESKENALMTAMSTGSSNVPAFSAVDQATLNQLASEDKEKEGKALNTFCTPFKGPKRKLKDKDGTKKSASSSAKSKVRKDKGDAAKGSAANGTADSSAADGNKSNQKVDATTSGAPSVQIIDGQIVLQESSVMLPSRRTVQEVEEEFRDNVVEEDEQLNIVQASYTSFVTKGDHGKTRKKGSWTIEETEKFYFALRQLGTDFGSMEALFFENQRTRKQLKNKYRKELTKNPDLVEELALNPKYQTQLDMTAFNLEVDPKRIEAHENEEPPAYEPTDVEEVEPAASAEDKDKDKSETNENGADYNGVFEPEVVEEDAEEERLAEARAQTEANKATTPTKKRKRTKAAAKPKKRKNSTSSWSATTEKPKESEFGEGAASGMDGFPREAEEGPSMDDFFGDSYADDEPMGGDEKEAAKNESAKKKQAPVSSSEAAKKKEPSQLVSLVPKKRNAKSRRPKIRPSRRKK